MKKLISLLLALVLAFGMMTGAMAADEMPQQAPAETAAVTVHTSKDPATKYYFETISTALLNWACGLEGDTIVTLTKNLKMVSTSTASNFVYIPMQNARWFNSKPLEKQMIFDLGGNTLSYEGSQNLFYFQRYGATFKNGTIDYTCIGGTRSPFCFGLSTGQTATTAGDKRFDPVLNLENIHVYNNTEGGGCIAANYIHGTTINVKDSVLWNQKWCSLNLSKTKQTKLDDAIKAPWSGPCELTVNIEGSTICSGNTYPVDVSGDVDPTVDTVKITVKDSTLVTNSSKGLLCNPKLDKSYNFGGQEATVNEAWSLFLRNGKTVTGKAFVYGNGGAKQSLPFTDVKEGDWFFPFVRDLYGAKVISGMTETTYAPSATLTFGQALKLITLAVGESEQPAVDAHWASGYMNFALDRGWLYNEVDLNGTISRLQFCQLAAAAAGISKQPASNPFTDTNDTSVLALYEAKIVGGMSETTFSPDTSLTRAQIAKIIFGIITH